MCDLGFEGGELGGGVGAEAGAGGAADRQGDPGDVRDPGPGGGQDPGQLGLVGMSLLVGVVLVMTLLLGQAATRPAPPAPPAPQGPVTPPLQLGPSAGGPARPE